MKEIFDIITIPISIVDNAVIDFVLLSLVSFISYKIAYSLVGETEFRGRLGSFIYWILWFYIYVMICYLIKTIIKIYDFIVFIPIQWYLAIILIIIIIFVINYTVNHKQSILNKKIF